MRFTKYLVFRMSYRDIFILRTFNSNTLMKKQVFIVITIFFSGIKLHEILIISYVIHTGYVNLNFWLFHYTVIYLNKLACLKDLFKRLNFNVITFIWSHISLFIQLTQTNVNSLFPRENKHCCALDNDQRRLLHFQKWWRT